MSMTLRVPGGRCLSVVPKILVIDDNPENRALAKATLEDEGYEVVLAAGGEEGIRAFESTKPDCVLLDVHMPGTDGFAVCSRIRVLPAGVVSRVRAALKLRRMSTELREQYDLVPASVTT